MRRSLLLLNLVLLAAAGLLGYRLNVEWKNYRSRVSWVYGPAHAEQPTNAAAPASTATLENWAEIIARNVFSAERTNALASASAAPPEPVVFGTMNLGSGPIALMSEAPGRGYRQVRLGEPIGGYKLIAVEGQKVTLEWPGGQIKIDAAESASRTRSESSSGVSAAPVSPPPTTYAPPRSAAGGPVVVSPNPSSPTTGSSLLDRYPQLRGLATREQLADLEREPPGTVRNGKIKRAEPWLFGVRIYWDDVKSSEEKKDEKK